MKKEHFLLGSLFLITFILYAVNLYLGSNTSVMGVSLYSIMQQTNNLKRENSIIREKILYYQSFHTIEKEARARGMVPETSYLIIR